MGFRNYGLVSATRILRLASFDLRSFCSIVLRECQRPAFGEFPLCIFDDRKWDDMILEIPEAMTNDEQKGLMEKAVRLSGLYGVLCRVLKLPRDDYQPTQYVTRAVQLHIALVVTKGIIDLELEVLSALQKLIFGSKGAGKDNMLPVWTALWIMILTYRDTPDYVSSGERRLEELARHLYDMLVSVYSGLFRPSSPLRLNWLVGTNYNMFGGDDILMQKLGTLKREFSLFREFN